MTRLAIAWLPTVLTLLATRVAVPELPAAAVALPPADVPVATAPEPVQVWLPSADSPSGVGPAPHTPIWIAVPRPPTVEQARLDALVPPARRAVPPIAREQTFDTDDRPSRVVAQGTPPSGRDDAAR